MSWIIMGFCIGIGLILAYLVLAAVMTWWKEMLVIVVCLSGLLLLFLAQGDDPFAHSIQHFLSGLLAFGFVGFVFLIPLIVRDPPQWLRDLSAAYQKRTGGKV
jgi:hypothetical protein